MTENITINYLNQATYKNDALNVIGATRSTTLRSILSHNETNCKYVRKDRINYTAGLSVPASFTITTPRTAPADGNTLNYRLWGKYISGASGPLGMVQDYNGTSQNVPTGAVTGGNLTILEVWLSTGTGVTVQDGDTLTIQTATDPGGFTIYLPYMNMTVINKRLWLCISEDGSSFYMDHSLVIFDGSKLLSADETMKYGGYRSTPNGTVRFPYIEIQPAIDACGGAFDRVTVLDENIYVEELQYKSGVTVQTDEGLIATIMETFGPSKYKERSILYNDGNTLFFNDYIGNDSNPGTWQEPKLTIQNCFNNLTPAVYMNIVYGGLQAKETAEYSEQVTDPDIADLLGAFDVEPGYDFTWTTPNGAIAIVLDNSWVPPSGYQPSVTGIRNIKFKDIRGVYDANQTNTWNIENLRIEYCQFNDINGRIVTIDQNDPHRYFWFNNNYAFNVERVIHWVIGGVSQTDVEIYNNMFDLVVGSWAILLTQTAAQATDIIIYDNIFTNVTEEAIEITIQNVAGSSYSITHNTFYKCGTGIYNTVTSTVTRTIQSNVFHSCTTAFYTSQNITIDNNTFWDYTNKFSGAGIVTSNAEIEENAIANLIIKPYNYCVSPRSQSYKSGYDTFDRGVRLIHTEIVSDSITVNGFVFDGGGYYGKAIANPDNAMDYDSMNIKWCSFKNYQGSIMDMYDTDIDINSDIHNNILYDSGAGIAAISSANNIYENIIYDNGGEGVIMADSRTVVDHNVIFRNQYGIYIRDNIDGYTITNNSITKNTVAAIKSDSLYAIILTYNCIVGNVDPIDLVIVNDTGETNTQDDPLFINTQFDQEDFNIKTIELKYKFDSPCKGTGTGGSDIGAYKIDRDTLENWWRKYTLKYNPKSGVYGNTDKGTVKFIDGSGSLKLFVLAYKRYYIFRYDNRSASTEELKNKLQYFSTLTLQGQNANIKYGMTKFLLKFLSSEKLLSGNGDIEENDQDSKGETKLLTDLNLDLSEDQLKGFWVELVFASGTASINRVTKTMTISGASFTADQFKGYLVPYNGYPYYIKSNTTDTLTISDPENTLINTTAIVKIIKAFRVFVNSQNVFVLNDPDNEIPLGNYDYYIDFIETIIQKPKFAAKQNLLDYKSKTDQTGFQLIMEES